MLQACQANLVLGWFLDTKISHAVMHNMGLVHSGISWWRVYTVVLMAKIPCSCCKYLAYEHFCEHCKGMVSGGGGLCRTTVMALPWCNPAASSLSALSWEISAVSCSKRCKDHFWTESAIPLYLASLGWSLVTKLCNKALYVPLFPASSALRCGHTTPHFCRGLGILTDQFRNVCVSFAYCLRGWYLIL